MGFYMRAISQKKKSEAPKNERVQKGELKKKDVKNMDLKRKAKGSEKRYFPKTKFEMKLSFGTG